MPAESTRYRDQKATEPEWPSKKTSRTATMEKRVVAIAIAIAAVFLLAWYFVPGDLPFTPPVPR